MKISNISARFSQGKKIPAQIKTFQCGIIEVKPAN
jgi:hypothetical protein